MKKWICAVFIIVFSVHIFVSCRPIAKPVEEMTPYEVWDAYIQQNQGAPELAGEISCTWYGNPSLGCPISVEPEVIEEVLNRLKAVSISPEKGIPVDLQWVRDRFNGELDVLSIYSKPYEQSGSEYPFIKILLDIYLDEDRLVLSKDNVYIYYSLDSDQTELKKSIATYMDENDMLKSLLKKQKK